MADTLIEVECPKCHKHYMAEQDGETAEIFYGCPHCEVKIMKTYDIAIAGIIKQFIGHTNIYPEHHQDDLISDLADYLATIDPRFDRDKFIEACK